jgi:hypothetical protein
VNISQLKLRSEKFDDDNDDDDDDNNNNNNNNSQNCYHFQLLRFPNLFLCISLTNTLSLCSSHCVSLQASHPQTTSKLNVLRILTFVFLDKKLGRQTVLRRLEFK